MLLLVLWTVVTSVQIFRDAWKRSKLAAVNSMISKLTPDSRSLAKRACS